MLIYLFDLSSTHWPQAQIRNTKFQNLTHQDLILQLKLATETMYDGGKLHNEDKVSSSSKDADNSKDTNKNLEK